MSQTNTGLDPKYQAREDSEHLTILAVICFIAGGIGLIAALVTLGLFGLSAFGYVTFWIAAVAAVLYPAAGICLKQNRALVFLSLVAILSCLMVPMGTAAGIFALFVLYRPSVRARFRDQSATQAWIAGKHAAQQDEARVRTPVER